MIQTAAEMRAGYSRIFSRARRSLFAVAIGIAGLVSAGHVLWSHDGYRVIGAREDVFPGPPW
jgi:hypothetical protein